MTGWMSATIVLSRANKKVELRIERTTTIHFQPVMSRGGASSAGDSASAAGSSSAGGSAASAAGSASAGGSSAAGGSAAAVRGWGGGGSESGGQRSPQSPIYKNPSCSPLKLLEL